MAELNSKYELSVWTDWTKGTSTDNPLGYLNEEKVAVIGADTMHTKISAFDINYKENINGEKTLTFSLPAKYRNEEGILLDNPLLKFLTSERKVKLRDGDYELPSEDINEIASFMASEDENKIWTDFIIKEIQEDSTKWINTYTCKELHVNELGKNGYSVLLDDSLGNNYGTLQQLSE